jgi:hypothetical protein
MVKSAVALDFATEWGESLTLGCYPIDNRGFHPFRVVSSGAVHTLLDLSNMLSVAKMSYLN